MNIIKKQALLPAEKEQVLALWNSEYPAQLAYADMAGFDAYLDSLVHHAHYLLVADTGHILGWFFIFERAGELWFAMILHSSIHGRGYGSQLLALAKENDQPLSGWVTDHCRYVRTNGAPYPPPVGFYIKNGFTLHPEIRLEVALLSAVKVTWHPPTTNTAIAS